MIRVETASRLHFGLFSFQSAEDWADCHGQKIVPARQFGGVGLMVQKPGVSVVVDTKPRYVPACGGVLIERMLGFFQRFTETLPSRHVFKYAIAVERASPEHCGLGTGTQLGLAVARAVAAALDLPEMDTCELARHVGRGERSALGIYGFAQGGFLVDGGKGKNTEIAPLLFRTDFPKDWRIVLVVPAWAQGCHGSAEREAFHRLSGPSNATDALCRLTLLGLLPALQEQNLPAFGEALHDFNARVGEAFAPVQGGAYAHPRLTEVVQYIRHQGIAGVGQSSWGPTLFAVTGDEERSEDLVLRLRERFGLTTKEVFATAAANRGASLIRE
jgi:beta-RFAP synthase